VSRRSGVKCERMPDDDELEKGVKRLEGRAVIVTGGGSGIGKGACLRIADEGGLVAVADIRSQLAEDVAKQINESGGKAIAVACDVADEGQVAVMVEKTVDAFGGLYGLVANAGTSGSGWIHETTLADWHFILGVNLTGPFLCAKHSIPHMTEAGAGCGFGHRSGGVGRLLRGFETRRDCAGQANCSRLRVAGYPGQRDPTRGRRREQPGPTRSNPRASTRATWGSMPSRTGATPRRPSRGFRGQSPGCLFGGRERSWTSTAQRSHSCSPMMRATSRVPPFRLMADIWRHESLT